jgi:hypothetical protein
MADIFISYSQSSRAQTEQLANELKAKGFTVWYDTNLVPGDSFRDVIMSETWSGAGSYRDLDQGFGRDGEAFGWAEKALQRNPFMSPATRIAAASAAFLGRTADATKYLALLRQLDPGLRVANIGERVNLLRAEDRERLADGLRRAGLPE